MFRHVVAPALAGVLLVAGLSARQDPAVPSLPFRSGVDLIPVDVSVLDEQRRPVRGLTAADFTILEDGRPRPVVAFTAVDLPAAAPAAVKSAPGASWVRDAPRDVIANDLPDEGRLVAIMIDRSIPSQASVAIARRAARAAVDQLGPGDLAAVVRSGNFSGDGLSIPFTADRSRLLDAVESPFMGMTRGYMPTAPNASPVPGEDEETADCHCGVCVLETISAVAHAMTDAPRRRKMLLLIGSAVALQVADLTHPCSALVGPVRDRMFRDLEMAHVTVHVIDPTGLITTSLPASYIVGQGENAQERAKLPARHAAAEARRTNNLRVLPAHTGGRVVGGNDPDLQVPAVFAESQSYYLLGFEPSVTSGDGRFRRIEVRANRRNVSVRTRSGYSMVVDADRSTTPETVVPGVLADAIAGTLPRRDLPVSASVVTFPGTGDRATVGVLLGVGVPGAADGVRFEAIVGAFDREGRAVAVHDQTVEIPGAGADGQADEGLLTRLVLPPGRYEIRAAVRDVATGRAGSVFSFVDVAAPGEIALSGILFRGGRVAMPVHALSDEVPFVPTVARTFEADSHVSAFVRVRAAPSAAVTITSTIVDAAGGVRVTRADVIAVPDPPAVSVPFRLDLPLAGLPVGHYLLRIEAAAGDRLDERTARFTVR